MDGKIGINEILDEIAACYRREPMLQTDVTVQELEATWNVSENIARRRAEKLAREHPERWAWLLVTDGRRDRRVLRRLAG